MLRNTKKGMPELRNYAFSQRCLIVLSNLGALKALSCSRVFKAKKALGNVHKGCPIFFAIFGDTYTVDVYRYSVGTL